MHLNKTPTIGIPEQWPALWWLEVMAPCCILCLSIVHTSLYLPMNIQWFSQSPNNRRTRRGLHVAMLVEISHNHGKPNFTLKELFYIRSCQVASSPVCSTIILLSGPDSTLLKDVIARIFISITARTHATLRRAADTNFGDYGGTFCIIL